MIGRFFSWNNGLVDIGRKLRKLVEKSPISVEIAINIIKIIYLNKLMLHIGEKSMFDETFD